MKSRDIIEHRNRHLGETGSFGSYDDVRRKDLRPLIAAGIVVNSLPDSSHNTPTRGYALHPAFARGFFALDRRELPDVVAHSREKDWIYVIEAVTETGPVDALRHIQFRQLLREARSGIVYVTAFPDRGEAYRKWMGEIAWETEVWIASEPDHLIHFDGERFLGPYPQRS